ncbi:MAG: ANTAR domain-containing protein [Oscillibacter sp.]|nr:ANTAR domain-containing protein [Oscillibacter sp.]
MDRILVAFANEQAQTRIAHLLESEGSAPLGCYHTGADVIRAVHKLGTACVICGFKLRDMTAGDLALSLRGTAALLVVSTPVYLDLCGGENLFKLPTPISRADFFASLDLIRQMENKTLRPPALRRKEDDRKVIDRAKALLMDVNRMTESEAHRFLQKKSMDAGLRMVETAQLLIHSYSGT